MTPRTAALPVRVLSAIACLGLFTGTIAFRSELPDSAWTLASPAAAQSANEVPAQYLGAWQLQITGRPYKLKTDYSIEVKIDQVRQGWPTALVSYFAGNPRRPSKICRTQWTLASAEPQSLVFDESLNYESSGRDACPVWDQVAVQTKDGSLAIQWRDVKRRKVTVKMEGIAQRSTGGRECREVGGGAQSRGQLWCRTPDGDWAPSAQ